MGRRTLLQAIVALVLAGAAGCTSYGVGFDDPKAEVSVVGELERITNRGQAFYFGTARNTGDVEVRNVTAIVQVFDAAGILLESTSSPVSAGVSEEEGGLLILDDTLLVDNSGTFQVQTGVSFAQAALVEVEFTFTTADFEDF